MKRRNFIGNLAIASAPLTFGLPVSGSVLGRNDEIRLGVIGLGSKVKIGGKGKQDLKDFAKIPGVTIAAICDCDLQILEEVKQDCSKNGMKVRAYIDFRELLEDMDLDAVSITTPNHSHALITIMACQARKHVFCQKPASHNIFEGRKMVEAASKYGRIVQVPQGPRGPTGFIEALAWGREGHLGKMHYVHGINYKPRMSIEKVAGPVPLPASVDYNLWAGPAPMSPIQRKYFHYDWHWSWETGNGDLGNMGIHFMDGCRMAVGANHLPKHVMSIGGRLGYDDDGQTPNTQIIYLEYEEAPIIFEVRGLPINAHFQQQQWELSGRISMDSYLATQLGMIIHYDNGYISNNQAFDHRGRLLETFKSDRESLKENFINAIRRNDPGWLHTDVEEGHLSAALVHMGNTSYHLGGKSNPDEIYERINGITSLTESFDRFRDHLFANRIDWEKEDVVAGPMLTFDSASEKYTGEFSEKANQHLSREYRKPFIVPEKV